MRIPWNSPGKNTGVGSHFHLQRIFPTQGSNLGLLHCRQILYHVSHQEKQKWFDFLFCYRFSQVRPPHPRQEVGVLLPGVCVCVRACTVTQSCLTLCGPMDCSLPGISGNGISQAGIMEWVAPGGLTDPGINTSVLHWQAGYLLLSHLGSPSAGCGLCQ